MKDYITYLKFDDFSEDEFFTQVSNDISERKKRILVTPNLDGLRVTYKNAELRRYINSADYCTIDGKPILGLAKKEKKKQFKYKLSGSDLVSDLLPLANKKRWSILLFGGKEGVGEKAKENIKKQYPDIEVKEPICPVFGFEKHEELIKEYIDSINSSNADIVLLCVGFPKAELFYFENEELFGDSFYMCVGATVDFLAGSIKRAPKWMSKIGLEWLYRLSKDFGRLFKRYWLDFWFLLKIRWIMTFNKKKILDLRNYD